MRRIAIGLLALWVSVSFFLHGTPLLGAGPELSWSTLRGLDWANIPVRRVVVCGSLAVGGLVLIIRGIGEEIDP